MVKNFVEYTFNSDTAQYPTTYDPSKINLGYLMKKALDSNNKTYVSPLEPVFLRGFENTGVYNNGTIASLRYNSNIIWVFYCYPVSENASKRIFLAEYNFSANSITEIGSIYTNVSNNTNHQVYNLTSSLELHTGGTISVSYSAVTGDGTNWVSNGVCVGNRIGFGSTNPENITNWYEITSVGSDNSLTIKQSYFSDGSTSNLILSSGTPYVIEDLRLFYSNYGGAVVDRRASYIVKGLRKEVFVSTLTNPAGTPTNIPLATTVDNQRACYRMMDNATASATYSPIGFVLENKVSFTEQYGYAITYVSATQISVQKFNVRTPLTGLTSGRSVAPFLFTTGAQTHNGSNTLGYNDFWVGPRNSFYATHNNRISRIPFTAVTSASTTFIADQMLEVPPGGTNNFAATSTLDGLHYLPVCDKFYINNQGGYKNYITPYVSGSSQFERFIHINDTIQQSSYLDFNFDFLTPHTLSTYFSCGYNSGISFLSRLTSSSNNIMYALPLEADKEYSNITNAFIITPKITTLSAVTYDNVYFDVTDTWSGGKFTYPREIFDSYYRIIGIDDDSGLWTLINQNGYLSGITSSDIQFKFTFRTIGNYCVPTRIHGLTLTYTANTNPISTTFYEPSLNYTNISSKIFAWRQKNDFETNIPNLKLDIYNINNNNLLLTDDVNNSSNGIWQYSSDGNTWNSWVSSANTIGNYIRYSASTLSASGLKVKSVLYI